MQKIALNNWLDRQKAQEGVRNIILACANSCAQIAKIVRAAPLKGQIGASKKTNIQGEVQKDLDIIANDLMVDILQKEPMLGAMVSEEVETIIPNPNKQNGADLVLCFDPLDGSSNIDTNSTIGTIFSLLKLSGKKEQIVESDILTAANNQKAAGFALYGPACLLVLSVGNEVALFALDESDKFLLVNENITIAERANEFAINMSYQKYWERAVKQYIEQCLLGKEGERGKSYNMRWAGSMVADVFRIFMHGGIFIYPAMNKVGSENGKLRFLYEANPMAMLVEKAGGLAISNPLPIREIKATSLHQRAPVVLGSREEVDYLRQLYEKYQ